MDGYLQTGVDGACERQSVKNPKGIYIVVFAAIAIVGTLIIIVVIAIRITKRIKNNAEMSERVRLLATSQDRTPTTDPATPSRTFTLLQLHLEIVATSRQSNLEHVQHYVRTECLEFSL